MDIKSFVYKGSKEETNKFQFTILIDSTIYNVVFKDGYPQVIENVNNWKQSVSDEIIEECCKLVELWFENNKDKHSAWWVK